MKAYRTLKLVFVGFKLFCFEFQTMICCPHILGLQTKTSGMWKTWVLFPSRAARFLTEKIMPETSNSYFSYKKKNEGFVLCCTSILHIPLLKRGVKTSFVRYTLASGHTTVLFLFVKNGWFIFEVMS